MRNTLKYIIVILLYLFSRVRRLFRGQRVCSFYGSRYLVVSLSGIGNAIMCTPLVDALKKKRGASIDVLTRGTAQEIVFTRIGMCDTIYLYPDTFVRRLTLIGQLRKKRYDVLILTFPTPEISYALLPVGINPRTAITHAYHIYHQYFKCLIHLSDRIVDVDESVHDIEQNLNLAGISEKDFRFRHYPTVTLSESANSAAENFFSENGLEKARVCLMHPGCKRGADYKRWPLEHFIELGIKLLKHNVKIIVIFGPDEYEYRDQVASKGFIIFESTDFEFVLAVLNKASMLISNDSGIMHAASFLRVPTVTLWGGTDSNRNGARGNFALDLVNKDVHCRPCVRFVPHIHCPRSPYECVRKISVDQVYKKILQSRLLGDIATNMERVI